MTILETLHLRMAGDNLESLVERVREATDPSAGGPRVSLYHHARVQGDLLVQLAWNGPTDTDQPSELGLRLASLLRGHGLVEHSVWIRGGESQETG
jgi:hypothetical protein